MMWLKKWVLLLCCACATFPSGAATNQFAVTASSTINYTINGVNDPTDIVLVRGFTYYFNISVSSIHPFYIKTAPVTGTSTSLYNDGVTGQGATSGTLTFVVPETAPNTLYYQCSNHAGMTGPLTIVDAPVVFITGLDVGGVVELQSTGTDALNLNVQTRSSLTNAWSDVSIQSNGYANGTNTTQVAVPAGDAAFFHVQQGFF